MVVGRDEKVVNTTSELNKDKDLQYTHLTNSVLHVPHGDTAINYTPTTTPQA